jgi:hypothetical protein
VLLLPQHLLLLQHHVVLAAWLLPLLLHLRQLRLQRMQPLLNVV